MIPPRLFRTRPKIILIQKTSKYLCRHSTTSIYDQSKSDNLPVPSTGTRPGKVYQPLYDNGEYRTKAQMEEPQFTIPCTTHYEMPEHLKKERKQRKYYKYILLSTYIV